MIEYNFDTCKKDLYDLFTTKGYYKYATLNLAILYSNLGELSLARNMYETLMFLKNPSEYIEAFYKTLTENNFDETEFI